MHNQLSQSQKKFELGIYTLADIGKNLLTGEAPTQKQRLEDILAAAKIADEAGLDVFGVGEQQRRNDNVISSPAIVLAAISQITNKLKLINTTTVLNTIDPIRLFEDFATLDLLSDGRAELMVGRGAFTDSFHLLGYEADKYDELFGEHLELLLALNKTNESLQGEHRTVLPNVPVSPRPLQAELPIWVAADSLESAKHAGRLGVKLSLTISGGAPEYFLPIVENYYAEGKANGHASDQLGVTVAGHMFLAESDELARRKYYPYYSNYWSNSRQQRGMNTKISEEQFRQMSAPDAALFVGSPDLIIEKILQQHELYGHQRFLAQVDNGGLPFKYVARNIEWFATRVAPIIRRELNKG